MSLKIRRVVTGHNEHGKAIVEIDELVQNVISNRPGASSSVIWSSQGFPVDNDGFTDPTKASFKTTVDNGSVFRVVQFFLIKATHFALTCSSQVLRCNACCLPSIFCQLVHPNFL